VRRKVPSIMSVSVEPGATQFTVTPWGASSFASPCVRPTTANFAGV
jgi:hypothetical protein